MLRAAILSAVLLIAQLSGEIDAASVMTTNGRVQGKILTENAETVTVGAESGSTQVIKRFDILIIYDDAGDVEYIVRSISSNGEDRGWITGDGAASRSSSSRAGGRSGLGKCSP